MSLAYPRGGPRTGRGAGWPSYRPAAPPGAVGVRPATGDGSSWTATSPAPPSGDLAGRPNLTPVWFDYEGNTVLLNLATHREKVDWLRADPQATFLLMNPANPYHWLSIEATVTREVSEDDPEEGPRVTAQLDRIWRKYTGDEGPYGLRDPGRDERRVLFELRVDTIATFGRP